MNTTKMSVQTSSNWANFFQRLQGKKNKFLLRIWKKKFFKWYLKKYYFLQKIVGVNGISVKVLLKWLFLLKDCRKNEIFMTRLWKNTPISSMYLEKYSHFVERSWEIFEFCWNIVPKCTNFVKKLRKVREIW